jgi:hypothetical protein
MDVELIQQINDQLREMNELLGNYSTVLSNQLQSSKAATGSVDKQKKALNELSNVEKQAAIQSTQETKLSEISTQAATLTKNASQKFASSLSQGKNAVLSFANSLLDSTPGLTKYATGLTGAAEAAGTLASVFGPLGSVVGLFAKSFAAAVSPVLRYNDALMDAYDSFARVGAGLGTSASEIAVMGRNASLSSQTLPYLTKSVESLGVDLRALGTTSLEGAENFAKIIAVGDKQLQGYRKLGITQEELIQSQENYIKLQASVGANLKKSPEQLQEASLKYIDNLNKFNELTGISKKKQEEALALAYQQENFNAYMFSLNQKLEDAKSRGDKEQTKLIQNQINAKNNLAIYAQNSLKAGHAQSVLEALSTDGQVYMSEGIAALELGGIGIVEIVNNTNKGIDQTYTFAKQQADGIDTFNKGLGVLTQSTGVEGQQIAERFAQSKEGRAAYMNFKDMEKKGGEEYFNKEMERLALEQERVKNQKEGVVAKRAEAESKEREMRLEFDDLMAKMSVPVTNFINSAVPLGVKSIEFVSNNFDTLITVAKGIAIAFASLGAMAVTSGVINSIRTFNSMVGGFFGKKTGELGSSGNPMYAKLSDGQGSSRTSSDKKTKGGKTGKFFKGTGKVALASAGIAAAGFAASSLIGAFDNEDDLDTEQEDLEQAAPKVSANATEQAAPKVSTTESTSKPALTDSETVNPEKLKQISATIQELDKAKIDTAKVTNNAAALVVLPQAMAKLPADREPGKSLDSLSTLIGDPVIINDLNAFGSTLNLDPEKTKNNTEAFINFSTELASFKVDQQLVSTVNTITDARLNRLFGEGSIVDTFIDFTSENLGKFVEVNAAAFLNFSKAMNILSGGNKSTLGDLANAAVAAGSVTAGAAAGAAMVVGNALGISSGGTQQGDEVKIGNEIRKGGTVSWRTNNPGNVSYGELSKKYGAIGRWMKPDGDKQQRTTGIAIMPTYENGLQLKIGLWRRPLYQNDTLDQGVSRWTQGRPDTNLGTSYAKDMANAAGVSVDFPISKLTDAQLKAAAIRQQKWEGFKEGTVNKAKLGGMFKGPTGGYPIELHGTELVIPVTPDSILSKLAEGSANSEKMTNEILDTVTGMLNGNASTGEVDQFLELDNQMKEMLIGKINKMLDALGNKQTTSRKLLKHKIAG